MSTAIAVRAGRVRGSIDAVPMVRLVLVWTAALAVCALIESAAGVLALPLGALAPMLAVTLLVTWGTGRVAAAIVRSPAHDESALVTGLLLFLILPPTAGFAGLATAALVAAASTASKYLIRIGGRHVLNPAAAGLFLVGLTGLPVSAWWAGTPALFPVLLLAAVVVSVRMRLAAPVALLVVTTVLLVALGSAAAGFDATQAARSALLSGPALLLAGLMFTEPVTLAPRTGQRYAEAVLIAAVLAAPYLAPFRLGTFGPTPELALLVGNALAIAVGRPSGARLRLAGSRRLTPTAVEYAFTPDRPLRHRAGQYLELHLPHRGTDRRGARRSLTIVSPPDGEDGTIRVAVRSREPASSFKRALDALPEGAPLRAVTVSGGFTLPADRRTPVLLVAGGIGITPFVSQLRHDPRAGGARDVVLVYRVPSPQEVAYLPELASTGVPVVLVVPDPAALPALPASWRAEQDLGAALGSVPGVAARTVLVSGSPRFVGGVRTILRGLGVRRVRTDAFAGY